MSDLNITDYAQLPVFSAGRGTVLAKSLSTVVPAGASGPVKEAARAMMEASEALLQAWKSNKRPGEKSRRAADSALDRAWAALSGVLNGLAMLPEDRYPEGASARELCRELFPDGLTFLTLPHAMEWLESESRLQKIAEQGLERKLRKLVGGSLLEEVRRTHADYGEALGVTAGKEPPAQPERAAKLRLLRSAMHDYVLQVLAQARHDGAQSMTEARRALYPIDELRLASRRGGTEAEEEVDPDDANAPAPAPSAAPAASPSMTPAPSEPAASTPTVG